MLKILWYSRWIFLNGVCSGNTDMQDFNIRTKFAFVDIKCPNCMYIKHKFHDNNMCFPSLVAPRKPTYSFCFSFASNYKNRVWRNEVMMKKQVGNHIATSSSTIKSNKFIHNHIKNACDNQKHPLPYQNATLTNILQVY